MRIFTFNKLVRDKIPDDQRREGSVPLVRQLTATEHKQALLAKLVEESSELNNASPQQAISELADLQQIIDDLCALYKVTVQDMQQAKQTKLEKSGGFSKGFYIESIATNNAKWTAYYQKHPDKYPEITE